LLALYLHPKFVGPVAEWFVFPKSTPACRSQEYNPQNIPISAPRLTNPRLGHNQYDFITCGKKQDLIFHDGLGQPEVVVLSQQELSQPYFYE
jgi:hypothetical protein